MASTETVQRITEIVVETLGIGDRADTFEASTPLFGAVPELDHSQGVDFTIEDEEFTGELFETVGSLADFVESKWTGATPAASVS
jgi:acyl carrier protein